jgi:hypothetical protein
MDAQVGLLRHKGYFDRSPFSMETQLQVVASERQLGGVGLESVSVRRAFPPWNRSIVTEIYLRHPCSCPEILYLLTMETPRTGFPRLGPAGRRDAGAAAAPDWQRAGALGGGA